jgi:hypothetical protein
MNSSSDEVLQMFEKKERERFFVLERVIDNVAMLGDEMILDAEWCLKCFLIGKLWK